MQSRGRRVRALENQPELLVESQLVWQAFWDLHQTRPSGFDHGAVPFVELKAWMDLHCIESPEERVSFVRLIRAMDAAWFEWVRERQEKKEAK